MTLLFGFFMGLCLGGLLRLVSNLPSSALNNAVAILAWFIAFVIGLWSLIRRSERA